MLRPRFWTIDLKLASFSITTTRFANSSTDSISSSRGISVPWDTVKLYKQILTLPESDFCSQSSCHPSFETRSGQTTSPWETQSSSGFESLKTIWIRYSQYSRSFSGHSGKTRAGPRSDRQPFGPCKDWRRGNTNHAWWLANQNRAEKRCFPGDSRTCLCHISLDQST